MTDAAAPGGADGAAPWWRRPGRAWLALALLLALGSALTMALSLALDGALGGVPGGPIGRGRVDAALDWQPALALTEPWRAWSAAFVHYSALHVIGNAAGLSLTAAYGWVARVPLRSALAWLVAWPLTQLGLLVQPGLLHYGGVSGVVHAGVAIVTLYVILAGYRWVGGTVMAMLFVKLATESPWGAPLQFVPGWDIALAPVSHATGVGAGLLCCAAAEALARHGSQRTPS